MEERGVRWDSMETPSVAPSTPSYTALSSTISTTSGTCASVGCRYVGLHASGWCAGAVFCLHNGRALTCAPAPYCERHSGTLLSVICSQVLCSHRYFTLRSIITDPSVDSCGRHRATIVPKAMGTPPDMAEPRLSNKGFQAFSLEHPYSRLQAHSLNPGDPYEPRPDVHGMLSVSA